MAQNVQPVQTYYVPMPEEDLRTFLAAIDTGGAYAGSDIYNYISIAAIADDTLIYWDQSENGFEFNFSNPQDLYSAANPDGTQIWGDGNVTNGAPPGVPGDLISAGTVIVIEELVPDSPPGGSVYFGAGDRIGATKPISVVRAGWGSVRDTLHGGAVEVYDTSNWSTNYIVPLGTDTAGDNSMFEYVGLFIQAATDGTTLSIDSDADGTTDDTTTIDQGESYFVSGLQEGATVAANHPVQVDVMTGDVGSTYEARYFPLSPESLWADRYLSPVGTPSSTPNTQDTGLWLFNPGSAQITVTLEYRTSGNVLTTATQAVPAGEAVEFVIPATDSGVRAYSTGNTFYAFLTADRGAQLGDWGFSLLTEESLTPQTLVGLGLGEDPNRPQGSNKSPIWITPAGNGETDERVYVDYDGDPATGALIDLDGNRYDEHFDLKELEVAKAFDPDGDQTGALVYTLDPDVKVAAVWGQDSSLTVSSDSGLDMGTGVPPLPSFAMNKKSILLVDKDSDGFISPGDVLKYEVVIENTSRFPVPDLQIQDNLPTEVIYLNNSTRFVNESGVTYAIPDDSSPSTPFPLDLADFDLAAFDVDNGGTGNLPVTGDWKVLYEVEVEDYDDLAGAITIANSATVNAIEIATVSSATEPIRGKIGGFVWLDSNENGIQQSGERGVNGVTVNLLDSAGDPVLDDDGNPISTVTANDIAGDPGSYLFQGILAGDYRVEFVPSAAYNITLKDQGGNDDLDSDANSPGGQTDTFTLGGGQIITNQDAGLSAVPPQGVAGHLFNDVNSNGVQDPGEPDLAGVDVLVTDSASGTQTVTTDANGDYFAPVDVTGSTTVDVDESTLPANYILTTANSTQNVTVNADQVTNTADVGYRWNQLGITKVSSAAGEVSPGDVLTYTIVVTNNDSSAHNNVVLNDPLPAGTTYVNGSTTVTAPVTLSSSLVTNTVADAFASQSYALNTGSTSWAGDWVEDDFFGNQGSPVGDYVGIDGATDRLFIHYAFTDDERIHRTVDLTGATSARLRFDWETDGLDAGETLTYQVGSSDAGAWTTLGTLTGTSSGSVDIAIPGNRIGSTTTIRFACLSADSADWEFGEYVYIDNVEVEYTTLSFTRGDQLLTNATLDDGTPPSLVTAADAIDLLPGEGMQVTFQATVNTIPGVSSILNSASATSVEQVTPLTASAENPVAEGTVSGRLYYDDNGNGTQDAGETNLPNVNVVITDSLGNTLIATTDTNGNYTVSVPPGLTTANVNELDPDFPAGYVQTEGDDPTTVTAVSGVDTNIGIDGYAEGASIGDRVWFDSNGDGIQDAEESGINNVIVTASNTATGVVTTNFTDTSGAYLLDALPAGSYTILVDTDSLPLGYSLTIDNNPTTVTVALGEERMDVDFGFTDVPTLVFITAVRSRDAGDIAVIEWEVSVEIDTVGYFLEREVNGEWVRVNSTLIPAQIFAVGAKIYEQADPDVAPGSVQRYRIIELDAAGRENRYGPYTLPIGGDAYGLWASAQAWGNADGSADADPDGDGLNNRQEFLSGTDPLNGQSVLRITRVRPGAEGVAVSWQSAPGRVYTVQMSRSLDDEFWPVLIGVEAEPPENTAVVPVDADSVGNAFFRVLSE